MTTVSEHAAAVRELLAALWHPDIETVPLGAALGRTLAEAVGSAIDLPPFDNSQMDGYAVLSTDASGPLQVTGHVAAGDAIPLFEGGASAIMTGAPLPIGADAVVPIETVRDASGGPARWDSTTVVLAAPPAAGSFVRPRGSDLASGAQLLPAGIRLGPAQLGALAASGLESVGVLARPRVLLVSTGAELVGAGEHAGDGKIFDANSLSLSAAITEAGGIALAVAVHSDDVEEFRGALHAAGPVDLVVTSGGVSVGAHEVVRSALEGEGVVFGTVALQPGGPQGLGAIELFGRRTPVLAFPGNPVSALVSFELFLRPLLRGPRASAQLPLAASLDSPAGKHQLRRGRIDDAGDVELVGGPSSHLLVSYARSQALVHVPLGVEHLEAGDVVEVWRIDG